MSSSSTFPSLSKSHMPSRSFSGYKLSSQPLPHHMDTLPCYVSGNIQTSSTTSLSVLSLYTHIRRIASIGQKVYWVASDGVWCREGENMTCVHIMTNTDVEKISIVAASSYLIILRPHARISQLLILDTTSTPIRVVYDATPWADTIHSMIYDAVVDNAGQLHIALYTLTESSHNAHAHHDHTQHVTFVPATSTSTSTSPSTSTTSQPSMKQTASTTATRIQKHTCHRIISYVLIPSTSTSTFHLHHTHTWSYTTHTNDITIAPLHITYIIHPTIATHLILIAPVKYDADAPLTTPPIESKEPDTSTSTSASTSTTTSESTSTSTSTSTSMSDIAERLAPYTSDVIKDGPTQKLHKTYREEEDDDDDMETTSVTSDHHIHLLSPITGHITWHHTLSQSYLCYGMRYEGKPRIGLKWNEHMCIYECGMEQSSPSSPITLSLTHISSFAGMAYVQSSKRHKKIFCIDPHIKWTVIAEFSRFIFLYAHPTSSSTSPSYVIQLGDDEIIDLIWTHIHVVVLTPKTIHMIDTTTTTTA